MPKHRTAGRNTCARRCTFVPQRPRTDPGSVQKNRTLAVFSLSQCQTRSSCFSQVRKSESEHCPWRGAHVLPVGPGLPVGQCRNPSLVTSLSTGVRSLHPNEAPTFCQWDPAFPLGSVATRPRDLFVHGGSITAPQRGAHVLPVGPGLPVPQCRNPSLVTSLSTAFGVRSLLP